MRHDSSQTNKGVTTTKYVSELRDPFVPKAGPTVIEYLIGDHFLARKTITDRIKRFNTEIYGSIGISPQFSEEQDMQQVKEHKPYCKGNGKALMKRVIQQPKLN
jgi:hypothetical protein